MYLLIQIQLAMRQDLQQRIMLPSCCSFDSYICCINKRCSKLPAYDFIVMIFLGGGHKLFYKNLVYDVRRDVSYSPCCPELTKVWLNTTPQLMILFNTNSLPNRFPCHSLGTGTSLSSWTPSSEHHTLESSQDYRTVSILCWNFLP